MYSCAQNFRFQVEELTNDAQLQDICHFLRCLNGRNGACVLPVISREELLQVKRFVETLTESIGHPRWRQGTVQRNRPAQRINDDLAIIAFRQMTLDLSTERCGSLPIQVSR
jgi:hypothetical protein